MHCDICPQKSTKKRKRNTQSQLRGTNNADKFVLKKSALENTAKLYTYEFQEDKWEIDDIKHALAKCKNTIKNEISRLKQGIKFFPTLFVRFYKPINNQITDQDAVFRCATSTLFPGATDEDITMTIENALNHFITSIYNFCANGSGWIVLKYTHMDLNTAVHSPISTSSFIPLPLHYRNSKKGLINIRNRNNHKCLRYCLLAFYNRKNNIFHKNPQQTRHYNKYIDDDESMINTKGKYFEF